MCGAPGAFKKCTDYPPKPSGALIFIVGCHGVTNAYNRDAPTLGPPVQAAFAHGHREHSIVHVEGGKRVSALLRRVKECVVASPFRRSPPTLRISVGVRNALTLRSLLKRHDLFVEGGHDRPLPLSDGKIWND